MVNKTGSPHTPGTDNIGLARALRQASQTVIYKLYLFLGILSSKILPTVTLTGVPSAAANVSDLLQVILPGYAGGQYS